jgi:hypothetical protein
MIPESRLFITRRPPLFRALGDMWDFGLTKILYSIIDTGEFRCFGGIMLLLHTYLKAGNKWDQDEAAF